ncbi:MAG TPA: hypothetical protein VNZ50_10215 [Hyphomicrobiaceae bacterium]|nr:hypothetical protein [Hyphomicrobiaceae bacterium]
MNESLSPQEMIRANAEMVLAVARKEYDPHIGFDAAGVRWLDGYIQSLVDQGNVEATEELCDNLGSYLGTCIIETYGGTWQDTEHGWAVVMANDLAVFPFNKTLKHLTEGADDSVLGLFKSIPALMSHTSGTGDAVAAGVVEAVVDTAERSAESSKSFMSRIGGLFRRR